MKLRQSLDREVLSQIRRVQVGEVDHEIDLGQLEMAPRATYDPATVASCSAIYIRYVQPANGALIPKHLFCDVPIWVFLEYVVAFCGVLLHGSTDRFRDRLVAERLSENLIGWDSPRLFAYKSSVEAIFGAVLDNRLLHQLDCPRKSSAAMGASDGAETGRHFYYGIDYRALPHGPWTTGAVYLYRVSDFPGDYDSKPFLSEQPIRPIARVDVSPQDWPMLDRVSGVDIVALSLRIRESFLGYPWRREQVVHPHSHAEPQVAAMTRVLDRNLDHLIDLSRLARMADASPVAAMRMFRAQKGATPRQYHVRKRVERARELLRLGMPIAHVAVDTGFADQSHLTRQFREDLGLTPGQYLLAQESSIRQDEPAPIIPIDA